MVDTPEDVLRAHIRRGVDSAFPTSRLLFKLSDALDLKVFDALQARDESGKWTSGGGSGAVAKYEHPDNVVKLSEADFKAHPPKGYRYATNLGTAVAAHGRDGGTDISLSPQFFQMKPAEKLGVIYHEIGHGLSDEMLRDGTAFDLADKGAMGPRWGIEKDIKPQMEGRGFEGRLVAGPNGTDTPGEAIAETYSILHDEPTFLRDKFPALGKAVLDSARQHGYPVPSAALAVLKMAENQPRDAAGKWTSGGSGDLNERGKTAHAWVGDQSKVTVKARQQDSNGRTLPPTPEDAEKVHAAMQKLFGRDLTPKEVAALAMIPEGGTVSVTPAPDWYTVPQLELHGQGPQGVIDALTHRFIQGGSEYDPVMSVKNDFIVIPKGAPAGVGTQLLVNQVETARALGIGKIEIAQAAGTAKDPKFNGYYTWPRLGFESSPRNFANLGLPKRSDPTKTGWANATIQDVLSVPGGREAWQKKGRDISLSFDTGASSRSSQVLDRYYQATAKAKAQAKVKADITPEDPGDGFEFTDEEEAAFDALVNSGVLAALRSGEAKMAENQPRNAHGEWTSDGGGGTAVAEPPAATAASVRANIDKYTTPVAVLKSGRKGFIGPDGTIHSFKASDTHDQIASWAVGLRGYDAVVSLSKDYGYQRIGVWDAGDISMETYSPLTSAQIDAVTDTMYANPEHELVWDHYTPMRDKSEGNWQGKITVARTPEEFRSALEQMGMSKLWNPFQPRNDQGEWTSDGGDSGSSKPDVHPTREYQDKAELTQRRSLLDVAKRFGVVPDEIVVKANANLKQFMDGAQIKMNLPEEVMPQVFATGQIMNQFQSGTSTALLDTDMRMKAEHDAFGSPNEANEFERTDPRSAEAQHPKYAYMYNPEAGPMDEAEDYGGVEITFKPDVKDRTTITVGDSLRALDQGRVLPSPARSPDWKSAVDSSMLMDMYTAESPAALQFSAGYIEGQVHGPLGVKNIASIHLTPLVENAAEIRAAAAKAGIPVV